MIGRKQILDLKTGLPRPANIEDVANLTKLADALENYTLIHGGAVTPHIGGAREVAHVMGYLTGRYLKNCQNHGKEKNEAEDFLKKASTIAGGEVLMKNQWFTPRSTQSAPSTLAGDDQEPFGICKNETA